MRTGKSKSAAPDLFRELFESLPDAVLLVHRDRIVQANNQASVLFGYTVEELTSLSIDALLPERFRAAHVHARAAYAKAPARRPMGTGFKLFGLRRDGTEFPVEISLSPIPNSEAIDTICVVREISARLHTEERLALTQFAVDHAADGAAWLRLDGSIAYVNDAFSRMLGYSREELLSMTVFEVNPTSTPDGWRRHWQELKETGSARYGTNLRRKNGQLVNVDVSRNFLAFEGQEFSCSSYRDVTDAKRAQMDLLLAEQRLLRAVTAANVGLWDWDLDTNKVYYSVEWKRQIGYDDDEISDDFEEWQSRVHPDDVARVLEAVRAFVAGEVPNHEVAFRFRHKDGSYRQILARASKIFGDDGVPKRMLGSHVDMTEHAQLEAQLRQSQKMESVGQLAGGIAHDFNNVLTVISATVDLVLAQVPEAGPLRRDLEEIRRAGERATALTRQLLAFSRKQILQPEVLDLNAVVAEMETMLRRVIGEDITLAVIAAADLGRVRADPGQLEQVLANLAVNARDAMPHGGRLTIETHDVAIDAAYGADRGVVVPAGPYVRLTVSDTGVGMDAATRAQIFEPFYTTKGPGKGTGLGLSTVYGIVKQSGGFIWVYSEVGVGTSFAIYLPQVAEEPRPRRASPADGPAVGTETILVVEDMAGLGTLTARMLNSAGYTVLSANSGDEALLALEANDQVDLMITDVVMPGTSGPELAEQVGLIRPEIKVLYMSGYTDDFIVHHGVLDRHVAFLSKPFTRVQLTRKVRDVLDSQH